MLRILRSRGRTIAAALCSVVASTALLVAAWTYDGTPIEDVQLHDAGVWVTNQATQLLGRVNTSSHVLDAGWAPAGSSFDVLQNAGWVFVFDTTRETLSTIDVGGVAAVNDVSLPAGSAVAFGGNTLAVVSSEGNVYAFPAGGLSGFDPKVTSPMESMGRDAVAAVSEDNRVVTASPEAGIVTYDTLNPEQGVTTLVSGGDAALGKDLQAAFVGDRPVVMDRDHGNVILPGGKVVAIDDAADARIQQSGPAADFVAIATPSALVLQPLDGSEASVTSLSAKGRPAAPVTLAGCTYAAWGDANVYARDCVGDANDIAPTGFDGVDAGANLVFRVNRGVVLLNDVASGMSWDVANDMAAVNNWDDLKLDQSPDVQQELEDPETSILPDRTEANVPPVASDDEFGARAGRTTVLPVVDNDYDLNGDVLNAEVVDSKGFLGTIEPIRGGAALQATLPADAARDMSFSYRVSDGRGGTDEATVTVHVASADSNTAPHLRRPYSSFSVEQGGTIAYNVLPDWIDDEGDTMFLKAVEGGNGDTIDFSPDGEIRFSANPDLVGVRDLTVTVSDGNEEATGPLQVTVAPTDQGAIVTNADFATTLVGQAVVVRPLANDFSPTGEELRLSKVNDAEAVGARVDPNYTDSSFTFTADSAGTYYVTYLAVLDARASVGIVRVDVVPPADITQPPIAVQDTALVPPGESVLVDVLQNDTDPSGGILVVQSIQVPPGSGVVVSVLDHRVLRVRNVAGIQGQVSVAYFVSNGAFTTQGELVVLPIDASSASRPPTATDDDAVVRAGDVATIEVLKNDSHPDGLDISLDLADPLPNLADELDPAHGEAFASEDGVRFVAAPGASGTQVLTYQIVDTNGQRDSARIKVKIIPESQENTPPVPVGVVARAIAGSQVWIPVTTAGTDPDGDSVTVVGIGTAPLQGRVVEVGDDWLVYEAYPKAFGSDAFTYVVEDRLGARAEATVKVGIAPATAMNASPIAVTDEVVVRPGRSVSVAVLSNDSDPEGQSLALVADSLIVPEGFNARVVADRVVVTSPNQEGDASIQYVVSDAMGATAYGSIHVAVRKDAAPVAPIARDDWAEPELFGGGVTADVPVIANDDDPDGVVSDLQVTTSSADASVNDDGTVTVTAQETAQLVRYTVTDADGLTASAFIHVPATSGAAPRLETGTAFQVVSGEKLEIDLGRIVVTSNGQPGIVTEAERVLAAHADGTPLVIDGTHLTYTSAPGYYGPDAISVQVTDGATVDASGRTATLTVPIQVLPSENVAPSLIGSSIQIGPGEPAVTVDLARLASDPNPEDAGRLVFATGGDLPAGVSATVKGSVLSVSATAAVSKGTELSVNVTVTDGKSDPVDATVDVRVGQSSRRLATAVDDVVDGARPGQAVDVRPLANDDNPFADEGPLRIVEFAVESGVGTVTADATGEILTVTPAVDQYGTVVVKYLIRDVTDDPDRQVEGRVYVTATDRPAVPAKPQIIATESGAVTLEWDAPDNHGGPISEYKISASGGATKTTSANSVRFDGLTNGTQYTFTVIAVNDVGASDPSPASDAATPDQVPDVPAAASLAFGDRSVAVAWSAPRVDGTPITSYTLQISPGPASGPAERTGVSGTSMTWDGLENGVAYQVRIKALNSAGESEWSDYSASEVPAGAPFAPGKPTTAELTPVGNRAQLQVTWAAADGNGDPVSTYDVQVYNGSILVNTVVVPGSSTSTPVQVDPSETAYTFVVRGHNKSPKVGDLSVASDPRRGIVPPGAPTGVAASTPTADNKILVAYTPGPRNGAKTSEVSYQYQLNGAGGWSAIPGDNKVGPLTSGSNYTVAVRAVSVVSGVTYTGPASSPSGVAVPFGPIGNPGISATSGSGKVTFRVSAPATNGRPITSIEYCTNNGTGACSNFSNAGFTSGSKDFVVNTSSPGASVAITIRVTAGTPNTQSVRTGSGASIPPTPPGGTVSKGASAVPTYCSDPSCTFLNLNYHDVPNGTYTVKVWGDNGGSGVLYTYNNVPLSGTGTYNTTYYYGYPGTHVWIEVVGVLTTPQLTWY